MTDHIVNRVANSSLMVLDLSAYYPTIEVIGFDITSLLFMEMIVKEKECREKLALHVWDQYKDKAVAIYCSVDAILPLWIYLLITSYLSPQTNFIYYGTVDEVKEQLFLERIKTLSVESFVDQRMVIKGCGEIKISPACYIEITKKLMPIAKSILFGEPCSTVPIYKKKG